MTVADIKKLKDFISKRVKGASADGVVIGLSGGLDSTVVATLCVKALGKENVLGLVMPSSTTNPQDTKDGERLARTLGIEYKIIPINPVVSAFTHTLRIEKQPLGNLMARTRMCFLYYHANQRNMLVVGTGNKTEIAIGYFTKWGDAACDLLPIGDLYKTEVRALAKKLKVPEELIEKPPTAGLWYGQTDEGEIGMSYAKLDKELQSKGKNKRVRELVSASEHKRGLPPICKLT